MDFPAPKSLIILITNVWLVGRGGSETVVRDLALGFQRRGHRPIVYSPVLGEPAEELRSRGIPVVDDLRKVAEPPDIIHGQHFVQTAEAIIRFPEAAAVSMCHASTFWVERPPVFPQIQRYIAVDEACRDRLIHAEGIDPNRVELMFNTVNLSRVPPRTSPLASRPVSALAFTKTEAQIPILAEACARLGIAFDALGQGVGRPTPDPERELVRHDIVFATARSAIEALCAGCAVIVCDGRGLGGLVTTANYDYFRRNNFGLRSLTRPVDVNAILAEVNKYDSEDARSVSGRSRGDCDLETMLGSLEEIYLESIRSAKCSPAEASARHSALQTFLYEALPRLPVDPRWPWMEERDHLSANIARLDNELAQARRLHAESVQAAELRVAELESSKEELLARLGEADAERGRMQAQLEEADGNRFRLQAELDDLTSCFNALRRLAFVSGSAVTTAAERWISVLWVLKASRAARRSDWPAAEHAYARALRLNPLAARIWVQYGHSLKEQGDLCAAAYAYDRALNLDPSDDETARHFKFTVDRAQIAPAHASFVWPTATAVK